MKLHTFEQRFFHTNVFYLYFWSFFVSFSVLLVVAWFQWIRFMGDCGVDARHRYNTSRLRSAPVHITDEPDEKGCWLYSDNASVASPNTTFMAPAFQCIYYFSKHGAYT